MAKSKKSAAVNTPYSDKDWRAEDALRTLTMAEEIRADKSLMKEVEEARKRKLRELESIKVETAPKTIKTSK